MEHAGIVATSPAGRPWQEPACQNPGMRVTPPYEDHSVLPRPPGGAESPTTALYKAALGPVNTAYYLPVFERFDAAGRPGLVWNPAAGLLTLNWMAFRGLWAAAGVYLAGAQGLALMVLGLSRQVLDWPLGVELGVLGTLLVLSIALPGLYGNALLHADIRRRMATAVTNAHTVREACEALEKLAPSRKRLRAFMGINAVLVFVALAVVSFALFRPAPEALVPPAPALIPPPLPEPVPVGKEAASATKAAEPATPSTTASLPVAASLAGAVGVDGEPRDAEPAAPTATVAPAVTAVPAVPAVPAAASAPARTTAPPPENPPSDAPVRSVPAAAPRPAAAPSASSAPPPSRPDTSPAPHSINVGLFAEEANAVKVHSQLIEAGLPATMQTVEGTRGPRTRVRAGPFPDRPSADAAAQRIRSLGLEAQVFRQ